MITDQKQEELLVLHQQWLNYPITRQAVDILRKHRDSVAGTVGDRATNEKVPDNLFRVFAGQIKTLDTVIELLTNSKAFVDKLKQQESK